MGVGERVPMAASSGPPFLFHGACRILDALLHGTFNDIAAAVRFSIFQGTLLRGTPNSIQHSKASPLTFPFISLAQSHLTRTHTHCSLFSLSHTPNLAECTSEVSVTYKMTVFGLPFRINTLTTMMHSATGFYAVHTRTQRTSTVLAYALSLSLILVFASAGTEGKSHSVNRFDSFQARFYLNLILMAL